MSVLNPIVPSAAAFSLFVTVEGIWNMLGPPSGNYAYHLDPLPSFSPTSPASSTEHRDHVSTVTSSVIAPQRIHMTDRSQLAFLGR